jgi:hypothetical protein
MPNIPSLCAPFFHLWLPPPSISGWSWALATMTARLHSPECLLHQATRLVPRFPLQGSRCTQDWGPSPATSCMPRHLQGLQPPKEWTCPAVPCLLCLLPWKQGFQATSLFRPLPAVKIAPYLLCRQ